jgi:hypothetical protein
MKAALSALAAALVLIAVPAAAPAGDLTYQHVPGKKRAPGGNSGAAPPDFVTRLDRENVTAFINDVQRVVKTGSATMSAQDMADYFNNHIAEKAVFASTMKYEMPGYPAQESALQIGKVEYINGVLGGTGLMKSYEHAVEIKDVEIGNGGRSAKVKTVISEKGEMPWPRDGKPAAEGAAPDLVPMPVSGTSTCEQTIIISLNNFVQMQRADCYTVLSFDPFESQELGDDMFFGR